MKLPKNNIESDLTVEAGENYSAEVSIIEKSIDDLEDFHYSFLDFDNKKAYTKFIHSCESIIRSSYEYRNYIKYLKETEGLTFCSFLKNINVKDISGVTLEIHHYPLTLFDIVDIIIQKQSNCFAEAVNTFSICNEVIRLHYENMIGLVPLSKTLHELAHNGEVFINFSLVFGNVEKFLKEYNLYISDDLMTSLKNLNSLSENKELKTNEIILKKDIQTITGIDNILTPIETIKDIKLI